MKLAKHKKKRQRTSPDQLAVLERIFKGNHTPDQETRQRLSKELGMTSRRIQIWFQNKRAKIKKIQQSELKDDSIEEDEDEEEDDDEDEFESNLYSPQSSPEIEPFAQESFVNINVLPSLTQLTNEPMNPLPRFWL